jgi:hypothetical protein
LTISQLPPSPNDITAKHENQHHTRLSLWNPRTLKSGTLVAFDMSAHRQAKTNLYVANERSLMIRHATDDSPACESRSWRRRKGKASSRFPVKSRTKEHPLGPRPAITDLSQSQFQDVDPQTEEVRILKPILVTSPHPTDLQNTKTSPPWPHHSSSSLASSENQSASSPSSTHPLPPPS